MYLLLEQCNYEFFCNINKLLITCFAECLVYNTMDKFAALVTFFDNEIEVR